MAEVKDSSYIAITRKVGRSRFENLANQLFNGYVYNMSVDVGYGGVPTSLTLNLALNKNLDKVNPAKDIVRERKKDIARVRSITESQKTGKIASVGNLGNVGSGAYLGAQHDIAKIADTDFNIDPRYIGTTCSYDISIYNANNEPTYDFKNFKITGFSIDKKNNQKILTLTLLDNSFVLDKIYVGLLGRELALDSRSESSALVSNIKISCPPVGPACPGGSILTTNNLRQTLHFSNLKFLQEFTKSAGIVDNKDFQSLSFKAGNEGSAKENYVLIKSSSDNKSINEGYGAVIVLGEEEFKDAPCSGAEVSYTFDTLLKAMQALGIRLGNTGDPESVLKDKSNGKIRRSYTGTLRNVLSAWAADYAFTYSLDFNESQITIKSIDLSSSFTKENLLKTKLELENEEAEETRDASKKSTFVIKSQNLSYDLSAQKLKLYSSYYYKEAKDKEIEYERNLGAVSLQNINLLREFPSMFGSKTTRDFSGSFRNYSQVIISAVLGHYSEDLRNIYNYSIGALPALGFIPYSNSFQTIKFSDYANFELAISQLTEISVSNANLYNATFGFKNRSLYDAVREVEEFIFNFIGRYYWSPERPYYEGESGNESFYTKYEVNTNSPVEKVLTGELYQLPVFREARYLLQKISTIYSDGTDAYFNAFRDFSELVTSTKNQCQRAQQEFSKINSRTGSFKTFRFFHQRNDASYGVFQDLINDITRVSVTLDPSQTAVPNIIDLAKVYSPIYQKLTPVSVAALQAVLPVKLDRVQFGSFDFGMLLGVVPQNQIYNFDVRRGMNPIEYQNRIYSRCSAILNFSSSGRESAVLKNLQSCQKTLLYETCVRPCEEANEAQGIDDALSFASGPNPSFSFRVRIYRSNNRISDEFIKNSVYFNDNVGNYNLALATANPVNLFFQSLRFGKQNYSQFKNTATFESIALPSQGAFSISLYGKTTYKYFKPFENYIKGGLESPQDLLSIINNQNFSLELDVDNITPNLRELFSDETSPEFITDSVGLRKPGNSPQYIQYQGYNLDNPSYQFTTFSQYHNALKEVFDITNSSFSEPNLKFSADIYCSEISNNLKNSLSIDNGLTSLNINLNSQGLNINCSFESSPSQMENLDALMLRNRPNIKLVNTNVFQ